MLSAAAGQDGPSASAGGSGAVRFRVGKAIEDEMSMDLQIPVRHLLGTGAKTGGNRLAFLNHPANCVLTAFAMAVNEGILEDVVGGTRYLGVAEAMRIFAERLPADATGFEAKSCSEQLGRLIRVGKFVVEDVVETPE